MAYTVYILYSKHADRYYVGYTDDITRRLTEHTTGQTRYTSQTATDWEVVYTEPFTTRSEAMKRERAIKQKKQALH